MTRVLRSVTKKIQNSEDLSSKLSINKKSKTIKRKAKKLIEVKNEDVRQSEIWNINSILSNIFAYSDHKDLLKFNTVCKKWNNITNPIIHKTIKLDNRWNDSMRYFYKRINNAARIDEDVVECISYNAKYAHLIKDINFNFKLRPLRAIELFKTFRFICRLTIERCNMAQGQFLGMVNPLTQLEELTVRNLKIKNIFRKNLYNEAVQLPPSLKKLTLDYIELINNPELFLQTVNSHRSLVNFSANPYTNNEFLKPFCKYYPSLLDFEYDNQYQQTPQSLFKILENNPQLINLKLSIQVWSSELVSHISIYLINLEQLKISENGYYNIQNIDNTDIVVKFFQPTKIKKLNLNWHGESTCCLDSILLNCPDLEELDLNPYTSFKEPNSVKFLNISNSSKLKKLAIDYYVLGEGVFDSLLLKCLYLNELSISLTVKWKEAIKSIYEKCDNLEKLNIFPPLDLSFQEKEALGQELYKSEFFISNEKYKPNLTNLSFNFLKVQNSKAEYFKNFEKLKSIIYLNQYKIDYNASNLETEIDMDLWPGYILIITDGDFGLNVELKRY
jgi:hypothetical protein